MSNDLAKLIVSLRSDAQLNARAKDAVTKKLTALAIDPLLVSVSLEDTKSIARGGNRALVDHLLQKMTLSQLKKLSKSWDPQKKFSKEVTMSEVREHLTSLLNGAATTPPATKARARKK